ncbi:NAD(P)H quinone oxidoreductase [Alishewanella longhuensis]|uniref:NAD(P)H quinone oxidoreductase n=1 Tax=Alishewanella longhuensis TaxID=1091037 RepID=A0ABQ3L6C3_9ALTE|nr:NAD(P)H-quinone oxidoreductase [Alishewanella longhuensis]GHG77232.1 NAD(P)H quinone oxidoreductase [Alishewanella longhuensis]
MKYVTPEQMQVIQVQDPGKHSRLDWRSVQVPTPAAGELLLKVHACGINRADLMQRQGLYPAPAGDSEILGLEAAGTVVAVGDESLDSYLGQRCFGLVNGGGYAEYVLLPATQAMQVPQGWSMAQAAATAETFLTAYQLLFTIGQASAGQRVLIHAGASGVGTSAIQLAKAKGLQVAVTVGSADKVAACLMLGADLAINYRQQHFLDELKLVWPEGINLILDPVAGSYIADDIQLLAQDGKIVVYAMMGGRKLAELDLALLFRKRGQLICSTLRNRDAQYKARLTADFQQDFATALAAANIMPVIQQVFAANDIEAAHTLLSTNQTIGKLVLIFSH